MYIHWKLRVNQITRELQMNNYTVSKKHANSNIEEDCRLNVEASDIKEAIEVLANMGATVLRSSEEFRTLTIEG